ncbi:hypothetical protein FN846DRAFT_596622 [Sphaerosporella brunnea]|uniref:Uncharacterized protein n=1 Tax=Sphaerosporella brunnea TaxID=1250544 RepID=A0A5J5ECJ7_9PEZI|nr:hypothetical protein FN846DRAFT_596622 [Sphaerosporella brunnea]
MSVRIASCFPFPAFRVLRVCFHHAGLYTYFFSSSGRIASCFFFFSTCSGVKGSVFIVGVNIYFFFPRCQCE